MRPYPVDKIEEVKVVKKAKKPKEVKYASRRNNWKFRSKSGRTKV
jgi:hypothetical protein